jgi:hypothetical protein
MIGAFSFHCTTRQQNAHRTEEREVLYPWHPWHPWFGRVVFVHETTKRGGADVLRCSQSSEEGARCHMTYGSPASGGRFRKVRFVHIDGVAYRGLDVRRCFRTARSRAWMEFYGMARPLSAGPVDYRF